MKKEKTCGYLDRNKVFHKSEYSLNQANIEIEMREITHKIDQLKSNLFRAFAGQVSQSHVLKRKEYIKDPTLVILIEEIYSSIFEYQFEELISLKDRIDAIQRTYEERKKHFTKSPILRKDWWNDRYSGFRAYFENEEGHTEHKD